LNIISGAQRPSACCYLQRCLLSPRSFPHPSFPLPGCSPSACCRDPLVPLQGKPPSPKNPYPSSLNLLILYFNIMSKEKKSNSSYFKRTLLEWLGIAAVFGVLYATGLHTEVLGTMQRAMLWTGLFDAERTEIDT